MLLEGITPEGVYFVVALGMVFFVLGPVLKKAGFTMIGGFLFGIGAALCGIVFVPDGAGGLIYAPGFLILAYVFGAMCMIAFVLGIGQAMGKIGGE